MDSSTLQKLWWEVKEARDDEYRSRVRVEFMEKMLANERREHEAIAAHVARIEGDYVALGGDLAARDFHIELAGA